MCHLGAVAVRFGALRPQPGVVHEGAMTVQQTVLAVAAPRAHVPFIAPRADESTSARVSCPPKFVQPVVVDAEVVRDFVDHRHRDLLDDLVLGVADVEQRIAVDRNGVG